MKRLSKNNLILIVCIVVLMALNIGLLYRLNFAKSLIISENKEYVEKLDKIERDYRELLSNQFYQYESEGIILANFHLMEIGKRESIPISSVLNNKKILFFRFKETNCDACINSFMEFLNDISKDLTSLNMVILCGYTNVHEYRTFVHKNNLDIAVYNVEEIPDLPIESQENPYFFILDSNLRIKNLFIPTVHKLENLRKYLIFIKENY